jgi:hypothetical protein
MALRPFTRNPKKSEEDEETAPSEGGGVREFFSVDPRPADPPAADPSEDDDPPVRMSVPKPPNVSLPEDSDPGWYPDQADPGLMRYWDGFHLTGQSMRVEPPAAQAGEAKSMIIVEAADTVSPAAAAPTALAEPMATKAAVAPAAAPASDEAPVARTSDVEALSRPELIPFDESAASIPTESIPTESIPTESIPTESIPTESTLTVKVESAPPTPVGGPAPVEAVAPVATPTSDRPSTEQAPEHSETWTAMRDIGKETAEADEAITTEELVTATAAGDDHDDEPTAVTTASPPEDPGTGAGDVADWAQETERAVAKAQATGTPDAWQEAARAAAVVTEMAQTMRAMAEATRVAGEKARAAHDAVEAAEVAEQEAADAKLTSEQTSAAALEAAEAAKMAELAAAEAKQIAERTAQAMPKFAAVARAAVQASTDAEQKAKGLEGIVIKARTTNTPEAWSEALVAASAATGTGEAATPEA